MTVTRTVRQATGISTSAWFVLAGQRDMLLTPDPAEIRDPAGGVLPTSSLKIPAASTRACYGRCVMTARQPILDPAHWTWAGFSHRCSGLSSSALLAASHADRWLPYGGTPPATFSMAPTCMRLNVMNVRLRFVKSLSGPPEPGSR